jgi:hypothetical protein
MKIPYQDGIRRSRVSEADKSLLLDDITSLTFGISPLTPRISRNLGHGVAILCGRTSPSSWIPVNGRSASPGDYSQTKHSGIQLLLRLFAIARCLSGYDNGQISVSRGLRKIREMSPVFNVICLKGSGYREFRMVHLRTYRMPDAPRRHYHVM